MAGGVNIKVKFDVDKAVDQSLNGITKRITNVSTAFDSLVTKIKTGFDMSADSAKNLFEVINNSSKIKGIDTVINAINALEKAFRGGSISQDEYSKGIENLKKRFEELSYQADVTNKKLKTPVSPAFSTMQSNLIKEGKVTDVAIKSFDLPQLQQALVIIENQKKKVGQVGDSYQRLIDLQERIGNRLKSINLTTSQRNELEKKQGEQLIKNEKTYESQYKKLLKQETEDRRKSPEQYTFSLGMDEGNAAAVKEKIKELKIARDGLLESDSKYTLKLQTLNSELLRLGANQEKVKNATLQTKQITDSIQNKKIDLSLYNIPKLETASKIVSELLQKQDNSKTKQQYLIDLQSKINAKLQDQKRTTEQILKDTADEVRLAKEKAIAQRRADGNKQYDYAMGMQANTLTQIIAKTNELKFAKDNLNKSDETRAKQIKDINRELQRLKIQEDQINKSGLSLVETNNRSSRSFQELAQIAGTYFSVYAVKNFAMEMANVTGEFDLQKRSLEALLQNRIAADTIFEKIKATAIQSPFSVMQLTAATKQLAAYRIEADNLFDTTMMLSDVSAGLGVDMERLILAFGQVRAASVLRGTEVRQFTEAGIPLISLLADKFGELEGRVVSTGEVFDKISNRLVPFEMINEIFKDMTASGGMFYEMQKIQSETIKGRLVNLTDAYQIFLDKMGQSNSGIIKGFIGGLEGILRNMDSILPVLKGLVAGLITYKVAMGVLNVVTGQNVAINKIKTLLMVREMFLEQKKAAAIGVTMAATKAQTAATVKATLAAEGLNSAFARMLITSPWIALATAVAAVGTAIGFAVYNAGKFNRELEKIETKGISDADNLYSTFKRLTGVIQDTTKSASEHNDALEELKRTFKDILPDQMLNLKYLSDSKLAYDDVRKAIYAKIQAQTQEAKLTALQNEYGERLVELETKQIKGLQNLRNLKKEQAQAVLETVKNTYLETKSVDAALRKYAELAGLKPTKEQLYDDYNPVFAGIRVFLTEFSNFNKEIDEITNNTLKTGGDAFVKYGNEMAKRYEKIIDHLPEIIKYYENTWNKASSEFDYRQQQQIRNRQQLWLQQNIDELEKSGGAVELKMAQDLRSELKKILGDEDQRDIKTNLEKFAKQFGVSLDNIRLYLKSDQQGFGEWGEMINSILEQRIENLRRYKAAEDKNSPNIKNLLNGADLKAYEAETKFLQRVQDFYKLQKDKSSSSAKSKDPLLDAIKQEISLIEKLNNEYKKLVKEGMNVDDAKTQVGVSFKDSIDTINKILVDNKIKPIEFASLIEGDPQSILSLFKAQFESLKGNKEASKALGEAIGELEVKIKIAELDKTENEIKTFLEDIKKKYEISLEINEAQQGTRDLLMKMFGINEKDIINDIGSLMDRVNEEIGKRLSEQGVTTETKNFASLTTEQFNELLKPFQSKEGYGDIAKGLIDMFNFVQEKQKAYISNTAKAYGELLKNYADFNYQRILVAENAEKELLALDARYKLAELQQDAEYLRLEQAILNKSAQETAKINYEELKQSDEYLNLFDRIEILGEGNMVESYTKVRQGIVDAFASGTISLKQFKSQLAELDKQFQEFYMQTGNFVAYLKGGLDGLFKNMSETSYNIQAIAVKIKEIGDTTSEQEFREKLGKDTIEYLEKKGQNVSDLWASSSGNAAKMSANLSGAAKGMSTVAAKGASAAMWVQLIVQNIYGAIKGINELRGAFDRLRESQGEFVNQYTTENDKFWTTLGNFNETAMQGFEQLKSGNLLGALTTTIKSYVDIFSDLNELGDKQIQEKIDDTTKAIDRQKDALDRLQKAVDKQLGSDWLAGMNQIAEGYAQIAEDTQAKIDAERGKKNPDEDVLYQYEQDLLDAEDNYKETVERMVEELTGADLKSAAEDFASIWLDAFLQGEDAMAAIEDRFDQMIKNMVVKAIASKIVAGILQKTFDAVEDAVDEDGDGKTDVTQAEIDRINAEGEAAMILINEKLGALGGWFRDLLGTGGSVETLQKGIQGVTEQTAGIIEGYLNTIRYEIFRHTGILQSIQAQMQLNNNINSDILYQATLSYQVLVAIRDWQNSITTTDNGLPAIRVV